MTRHAESNRSIKNVCCWDQRKVDYVPLPPFFDPKLLLAPRNSTRPVTVMLRNNFGTRDLLFSSASACYRLVGT